MGALDGAWVLVIADVKDQAELCADVCAEAGLNAMTDLMGISPDLLWRIRGDS